MSEDFTMVGLQSLLSFPFKDAESKKKLFIASGVSLLGLIIPIIPSLILMGYTGAIMRQIIIDKQRPSMPEWNNWNDHLNLGAKLFAVSLVYSIPAIIPIMLGYSAMILPAFIEGFTSSPYQPQSGMPPAFILFGSFGGMALFSVGMCMILFLYAVLPPALTHAAAKNSFSAGFQIKDWWAIFRANLGGFIISMLIAGGLYMALIIAMQIIYLTIILCFLLPFLLAVVTAYVSIIFGALFAQAYSDGSTKLDSGRPLTLPS